jgi:iron complex outermembrane receptor protein
LGARLTLAPLDDRWSVTLFGDNILDNRHFTQVTALNAFPFGTLNDPRRYGVRTAFRF